MSESDEKIERNNKLPSFTSSTDNVYINDEELGWIPGRLTSSTSTFAKVEVNKNNTLETVQVCLVDYPSSSLPLQNVNVNGKLQEVADMVDLPFLHEAGILYNLKSRHERSQPYTRTGEIIIAVNPYKWMSNLYDEGMRDYYSKKLIWSPKTDGTDGRYFVDPHVYETSSLAYKGLASTNCNQSILVSGESGAGKTETVKILMSHLAGVQSTGVISDSRQIVKRVLDSNPLLESFGNAKTVRNDNSSRFGKFVQLQWHVEDLRIAAYSGKILPSCTLAGSFCSTYFLEKSRVVHHEATERNYHIFYELLAAPQEYKDKIWDGLLEVDNSSFYYVGFTDTSVIEGVSNEERFNQTLKSLRMLGLEEEEILVLFRALCIVLQIGNLTIGPSPDNDDVAIIEDDNEMTKLSSIMGVPCDTIRLTLTERSFQTKAETFQVPLNPIACKDSCDALAKAIYAHAFDWLVSKINKATCAESNYEYKKDCKGKYGIIALLDIFGFETFQVNRFEQFCINYANEKLQQKFTLDMFSNVKQEYEEEGISLEHIEFVDNAEMLKLVEGSLGLLAVLNEECVRPKGNDISFVAKIQSMNHGSELMIQDDFFRDYEFGIMHYAGPVFYDATHFVKKNMDILPQDLVNCACQSTNPLIQSRFKEPQVEKSPPRRKIVRRRSGLVGGHESVTTKFRNQLSALMETISQTKSRYIRCIKPNSSKKPLLLDHQACVDQLRCAGVVAAISISRASFPNRLLRQIAWNRFSFLVNKKFLNDSDNKLHQLLSILLQDLIQHYEEASKTTIQPIRKVFTCGKTRVYFRAGTLEYLEGKRLKALGLIATKIQTAARTFVAFNHYRKLKKSTLLMQANARMVIVRKKFLHVKNCCIFIQCWVRYTVAKDIYIRTRTAHFITIIQSYFRMALAVMYRKKAKQSSVIIQAMVRGALQRPVYKRLFHQAREEARIENQLLSLQRKLEKAEAKRIQAEKLAEQKSQLLLKQQQQKIESPPSKEVLEQQQALMDESHKMLDYLHKEVSKLRQQNSQLKYDFDRLKENNQRLMEANASAGSSFQALNNHAKHLNKVNVKLGNDVNLFRNEIEAGKLVQMELRDELKMKQATYIAEVQSRLKYQKSLNRIIDAVQARCNDDNLVEDVLAIFENCENEFERPTAERDDDDQYYDTPPPVLQGEKPLSSRLLSYIFGPSQNDQDYSEPTIADGVGGLHTFAEFSEA